LRIFFVWVYKQPPNFLVVTQPDPENFYPDKIIVFIKIENDIGIRHFRIMDETVCEKFLFRIEK